MVITLILLWILATLTITSISGVIGKRFGVEYVISVIVALVVIANVIAGKIVVVGSFTVTAAVIVYASTFLLTDIISEKWGKQQARKAIFKLIDFGLIERIDSGGPGKTATYALIE